MAEVTETTDISTRCAEDLRAKLLALAGRPLRDAVLLTDSEDDFKQRVKLVKTPFVGIMYAGLKSDQGADSSGQGMLARLIVLVIYGVTSGVVKESGPSAWALLAQGRNAIRMTRSPTGHRWRFEQEMYFDNISGIAYYTQTWSTVAPLTGSTG